MCMLKALHQRLSFLLMPRTAALTPLGPLDWKLQLE